MFTLDDMVALTKPHHDKIVAESTIERIRKAATKWSRCCDLWQDGFGTIACRDCQQKTFAMMRAIQDILGVEKGGGAVIVEGTPPALDPRDPDPTRPAPFNDHNCSRCKSGAQPERCPNPGNPRNCDTLYARND